MTWILAFVLAAAAPANPQLAIGLDAHVGARIPAQLTFTNTSGHRVALGSYFDGRRPVVLVLAYAHCKMLCSVVIHAVADAVNASKQTVGRDFLPVIVSIDPDESTETARHRQDQLLAEIHHPGARELWPYLTGDDASIHALAHALGFRYVWDEKTQQFAHPAVVFVLSSHGEIAEYLRGVAYPDFDDAITRARAGIQTPSTTSDILHCFHFDPSLRRYGRAMQLFLRVGAATVLFALISMIAALAWWNHRRKQRRAP